MNRVDVNDLKNFFLRWYGPNNATITIGGDVQTSQAVKLVEKYFSNIPMGPAVTKTNLLPVVLEKDRYVSYTDNYARIPQMTKVYPTVPEYHKDFAALACLAQILGQGKNSVLYQELVKTQKAQQASAFSSLYELAGEFILQLRPYPGTSLASMDSLLKTVFLRFEERGVTQDDIEKFKGAVEAQYINGLQSVSGKVSQLAQFETFTGNPNQIGKILNQNLSITREDVMRVYNTYIKGKPGVVLSVLPKNQEQFIAAPDNFTVTSNNYIKPNYGYDGLKYVKGKDDFDRSKIPGVGQVLTVQTPVIWKKEFPNGLIIAGNQNTELPLVTISVSIPGGHLAQANDTSKVGLAPLVADMLNEDTKNYSAEQLAVALQKNGSSISVSANLDNINFTLQCLTKNIDKAIELLEERILRPKFTDAAFNRIQKQTIEGIKQSKTQPAQVATTVFQKLLSAPGSFWGMPENGYEQQVKMLTRSDVENYYNNYITSQNTKVVVVGDVSEKEIIGKLQFLNQLPNKKVILNTSVPKALQQKTTIYYVHIPNAAQTEFRIGYNTGLTYDATGEFYKAGIMNYQLGSSFNSRLNMNLREEKGWTYGARSAFNGDAYNGSFIFSAGIRANATDSAFNVVMMELNQYAQNGIKEDELTFTKSSISQRDALLYETGQQKARFIKRILDYNLPMNYVKQQNEILAGMNKKEIDALSSKWIKPDQLIILLVGDRSKIVPGLQNLNYPIVELDLDGYVK